MRYNEIEYNERIDINKEEWKSILQNEDITFEVNKELLIRIYNKEDYMATAKELTEEEGKYGSAYNSIVVAWSKRIINAVNIEPPKQKEDSAKKSYWHVIFLGAREKGSGNFLWIIREELLEALEELLDQNIWRNIDENHMCKISEELENEYIGNEGMKKVIVINSYERDRKAVRKCLMHYKELNGKVNCKICGFDFQKVYGVIAKDKIHVHHKVPISEIKIEYKINAINDLIPVCPNCHMILHSKVPAYTVEELIEIMK
ncbi:MAG: HNH endonuclease [Sarcina sp.]